MYYPSTTTTTAAAAVVSDTEERKVRHPRAARFDRDGNKIVETDGSHGGGSGKKKRKDAKKAKKDKRRRGEKEREKSKGRSKDRHAEHRHGSSSGDDHPQPPQRRSLPRRGSAELARRRHDPLTQSLQSSEIHKLSLLEQLSNSIMERSAEDDLDLGESSFDLNDNGGGGGGFSEASLYDLSKIYQQQQGGGGNGSGGGFSEASLYNLSQIQEAKTIEDTFHDSFNNRDAAGLFTIVEDPDENRQSSAGLSGVDRSGRSGDLSGFSGLLEEMEMLEELAARGIDTSGRSGSKSGKLGSSHRSGKLDSSGRSSGRSSGGLEGSSRSGWKSYKLDEEGGNSHEDRPPSDPQPPYDILTPSDKGAPDGIPHSWHDILKKRDDKNSAGEDDWRKRSSDGNLDGDGESSCSGGKFEPPAYIEFVPDNTADEGEIKKANGKKEAEFREVQRGSDMTEEKFAVSETSVLRAIERVKGKQTEHQVQPITEAIANSPQDQGEAMDESGSQPDDDEEEEVLQMMDSMHTLRESQLMPWDVTDDGSEKGSRSSESSRSSYAGSACSNVTEENLRRSLEMGHGASGGISEGRRGSENSHFEAPPIASPMHAAASTDDGSSSASESSHSNDDSSSSSYSSSESSMSADEENLRGAAMANKPFNVRRSFETYGSYSFGYSDSTINSFSESNLAYQRSFTSLGGSRGQAILSFDKGVGGELGIETRREDDADEGGEEGARPSVDASPADRLSRQKHFLSSARRRIALDGPERPGESGQGEDDGAEALTNGESAEGDHPGGLARLAKRAFQPKRMLKKMGSRRRVPDTIQEDEAVDEGEDRGDDENDSLDGAEEEVKPCPAKKVHSKRMLSRQGSYRRTVPGASEMEVEEGAGDDNEAWEHPNSLARRQSSKKNLVQDDSANDGDSHKNASQEGGEHVEDADKNVKAQMKKSIKSADQEMTLRDKLAEEKRLAARGSFVLKAEVVHAEGESAEPAKHGFEPKKVLRMSSSRVMKALDATAEKVASVTDILDATAEKVGSVMAAEAPPRPMPGNNVKPTRKKGSRGAHRHSSRKDMLARERALKRRERQQPDEDPAEYRGRMRRNLQSFSSFSTESSASASKDEISDLISEVDESHSSHSQPSPNRLSHAFKPKPLDGRNGSYSPPSPDRRSNSFKPKPPPRVEHVRHRHHSARYDKVSDASGHFMRKKSSQSFTSQSRGGQPPSWQPPRDDVDSGPVSWDDLSSAIEASCRSSLVELHQSSPDRQQSSPNGYAGAYLQEQESASSFSPSNDVAAAGAGGSGGPVSWDDLDDAIEMGLRSSLCDLQLHVVENQNQEWRSNGGIQPPGQPSRIMDDDSPWQCTACTCINENGMFLLCSACNQPRMSRGIALEQH